MYYVTKFTVVINGSEHSNGEGYAWSTLDQALNEMSSVVRWYGNDVKSLSLHSVNEFPNG